MDNRKSNVGDRLATADAYIQANVEDDGSARVWSRAACPEELANIAEGDFEAVIAVPPGFKADLDDLPPAQFRLESGWAIGVL